MTLYTFVYSSIDEAKHTVDDVQNTKQIPYGLSIIQKKNPSYIWRLFKNYLTDMWKLDGQIYKYDAPNILQLPL
jgi:hypothetical protein